MSTRETGDRPSISRKVGKGWLAGDVVFVDEIPHTAPGKIHKTKLRERLASFVGR